MGEGCSPHEPEEQDTQRNEAAAAEAMAEKLLAEGAVEKVPLAFLVRLAWWAQLTDDADLPKRRVGIKYATRLQALFRAQNEGVKQMAVFPRAGVVRLADGEIQVSWFTPAITFDYSDAAEIVARIDVVAEEAYELLPHGELQHSRETHLKRAYGLATLALAAVHSECAAHKGSPELELPSPRPRFTTEMRLLHPLVRRAEQLLSDAAQSAAQTRYGRGMAYGTVLLFAVTALLGVLFLERGWSAQYAIGIPAGGLGAVVSVLQRMTSGSLVLRTNVGASRLKWFGVLRPWVGALFGTVLVGLLEAKLLNLDVPEGASAVAFYGVLAFFFGFNERFAQDALTAAASPLGSGATTADGALDGPAEPRRIPDAGTKPDEAPPPAER